MNVAGATVSRMSWMLSSLAPRAIDKHMVRHIQQHIEISNIPNEENCGRNTINDLFLADTYKQKKGK